MNRTLALTFAALVALLSTLTGCECSGWSADTATLVVEMSAEEKLKIHQDFQFRCRQRGYGLTEQLVFPRMDPGERFTNTWLWENMSAEDQYYRMRLWAQVMDRAPEYDYELERSGNPPVTEYQVWQEDYNLFSEIREAIGQGQLAYDSEEYSSLADRNKYCQQQIAVVKAYLDQRDDSP